MPCSRIQCMECIGSFAWMLGKAKWAKMVWFGSMHGFLCESRVLRSSSLPSVWKEVRAPPCQSSVKPQSCCRASVKWGKNKPTARRIQPCSEATSLFERCTRFKEVNDADTARCYFICRHQYRVKAWDKPHAQEQIFFFRSTSHHGKQKKRTNTLETNRRDDNDASIR